MNTLIEFGLSNAVVATVLAVLAWLATRAWRRPQLAFALWLLVLAKLVTPGFLNLPIAPLRTVPETIAVADVPLSAGLSDEARDEPFEVFIVEKLERPVRPDDVTDPSSSEAVRSNSPTDIGTLAAWTLTGCWIVGTAAWFLLATLRVTRFARIVRRATEAPDDLQTEVHHLAGGLGLARVPRVRLVHRPLPPLVWAMAGHSVIVLPSKLVERLSADERTTLLAHELAHLARRDHLVRWLELAALGLYWWHPVAWWAHRKLEEAEEHCCDQRVLALLPNLAQPYAEALLATVDFLAEGPAAMPLGARGFSQARFLERRMEMILSHTNSRRVRWPLRLASAALALCVLPLSVRSVWADPAQIQTEDKLEIELVVTAEPAADVEVAAAAQAPAEEVVGPVESKTPAAEARTEVRVEKTLAKQGVPDRSREIEKRLDRLEKLIAELAGKTGRSERPAGVPADLFEDSQAQRAAQRKRQEEALRAQHKLREAEKVGHKRQAIKQELDHVRHMQKSLQSKLEDMKKLEADLQKKLESEEEIEGHETSSRY